MFTGTVPNGRLCIVAVVAMGLVLGVAVAAKAAPQQDESFEEKLRKAVETQTKKNQADDDEQKRLAAAFAAKQEATQKQEETELRQSELAFGQKMELLKQEQAARQRRA